MYEKVQNYKVAEIEMKRKQAEAQKLTDQLKSMQAELFERLAELPLRDVVPGMELIYEIGEDEKGRSAVKRAGLFLEELPFHRNQHSYGKLIKCIIKLSAHYNADRLNFIPIGDWNLLDPDAQAEILALPQEHPELNIQLGIEKVDGNREIQTEIVQL
jgi:hypothetical protein